MNIEEPGGRCPNCTAPLSGPFCASCGQRQIDLDRPFREIASEAMEAFVSFDTRIFRTLWPLIVRPGFLTVEFFEGRRARYVHPFKLYFAFSVLLFVGLAMTGFLAINVNNTGDTVVGDGKMVTVYTTENETEESSDETNATDEVPETVDEAEVASDEDGSFLSRFFSSLGELVENDPDRLNKIFTDRMAKSVIILVPVFALLLRLLYWKIPYIKQLVFSLHLHSFAFLVILLGILIDTAMDAPNGKGFGNAGASLAILGYAFLALRRAYGQGRFLTGLKMVVLLLGYLLALILTMIVTLIVAVLTV